MNRYLVISYDKDEQQWFYDVVFADDSESAGQRICDLRPYVMDADVLSMTDLSRMAATVPTISEAESAKRMAQIAEESGVEL